MSQYVPHIIGAATVLAILFMLFLRPIVVAVVGAVVDYLRAKGMEISEPTKDIISDRIVMAVEQLADRMGWKGEKKLEEAVARILDKIPGVSLAEAEDLAEASVLRLKNGVAALAAAMAEDDDEEPEEEKPRYL